MKTEHTQGPWTFSIEEQGRCVVRSQTTGLPYVGQVLSINARLIAAAPDLLAALRELCADKYLADPINSDRMKNARVAISKAEGNA